MGDINDYTRHVLLLLAAWERHALQFRPGASRLRERWKGQMAH